MNKRIDIVWANILRHESETFRTIRGISYTYVVKNDFILINNDPKRRITKEKIEKSLLIENPSPSKIEAEGIWGPSYVYGIITDDRIRNTSNLFCR